MISKRAPRLLAVAALLFAGSTAVGAAAAESSPRSPQRIMSMNMCADLLLLQLVPKERIASISYLAPGAAWAVRPGLADGVALNRGSAEDVAHQQPDLIVTGDTSTPAVRRLAGRVGAPIVELKSAQSFQDIRDIVRQLGRAVGEPARAEALVAGMDAILADLARTRPARPVVVAAWSGESVPGRGTLANAIIEAAGAVNVATVRPDNRYGTFSVEQVLEAQPHALLYSGSPIREPSVYASLAEHPAVLKRFAGRRISYPDPLYICGLPQSAAAAAELRQAISRLPPPLLR